MTDHKNSFSDETWVQCMNGSRKVFKERKDVIRDR